MFEIMKAFWGGVCKPRRRHHYRAEQKMRDQMPERDIDKMIDDSFPASDPPSTY